MNDGFLHQYFLNNPQKPIYKWIHYFDIYERHFAQFRGKAPVLVEIGVLEGGSLQMWKDYFGAGSQIVGIDINPACAQHAGDGIDVIIGSQSDPAVIDQVFAKYPQVDIVIDDGSHLMPDVLTSFKLMYSRLQPHGVYLIEDTHTSYWDEYGGGWQREGAVMEFVKAQLDALNAVHTRGVVPVSEITRSTRCIVCYDSIVVFERCPQGIRQTLITQAMDTPQTPYQRPDPKPTP